MSYKSFNLQQSTLPGVDRQDHSNRGKAFEKMLSAAHSEYEARGWAQIDKHPVGWEYISEKEYQDMLAKGKKYLTAVTGSGRKMAMAPSNVDFSGTAKGKLLKVGVHVKFDAKMCKGDRIPLDNFKLHQVNNLIAAERCGAVAGFMIMFWEIKDTRTKTDLPDEVVFCPPMLVRDYFDRRAVRARAKKGEGAIFLSEIKQKGIVVPRRGNLVDWLPAVLPHAFNP